MEKKTDFKPIKVSSKKSAALEEPKLSEIYKLMDKSKRIEDLKLETKCESQSRQRRKTLPKEEP